MRLAGSGYSVDELAVTERMDRSSFGKEKAFSDSQPTERPNTHIIAQLSKDLSDLLHTHGGSTIPPTSNRPILEASPSMDRLPVVRQPADLPSKLTPMDQQVANTMPAQAFAPPQPMFPQSSWLLQEAPQAAASQTQLPLMQIPQVAMTSGEQRRSSPAELEVAPRNQLGGRSPREVQFLLNTIESREAALRAKVQQLAEEKSSQQQRLEEQVRELQRSNAQMDAELRRRQRTDNELFNMVDSSKDIIPRSELANALRDGAITPNGVPQEAPYGRSPVEDRTEQSSVVQDTREDLQQQLAEIRSEVARCASALCGDEPLPTSEVADIRQQLAALSSEVMQTSRALLAAPGLAAQLQGPPRDAELAEVRRQLEALQNQVSRAMYAALSRPGIPPKQDAVKSDELHELRAEVGRLRAEVSRNGRLDTEATASGSSQPAIQDLGAQVEALRSELGSFIGGIRSAKPFPRGEVRQPAAREVHIAPEAAGLQERLSWLRAEVARVIHDPRHAEDPAHPELRQRLSTLLRELQDLRQGAEVVAASSGGSPRSRRAVPGILAPAGSSVLRETELRYPMGNALPTFSRARSSTPRRHSGIYSSGFLRPESMAAANAAHYANAMPTVSAAGDWATGASLRCGPSSIVQPPVVGVPMAPPVLVCPHVAADIAAEQALEPTRYANHYTDRYVDHERLSSDAITRGVGLTGDTAPSSTPTLGRGASPSTPSLGAPSLSAHGIFHRAPGTGSRSLRSFESPDGYATPPVLPGLSVPMANGSTSHTSAEALAWAHEATSWSTHPNTSWSAGHSMPVESLSAPADEPPEVVPQGNMWRPMRSKLSR